MKSDPLTAEVTAENLDEIVEKVLAKVDLKGVETNLEPVQAHSHGLLGKPLVRRMSHGVRQADRPATTQPLNLNVLRTLHDLFKQDTGPESLLEGHQGERKAVVLQKRV